MKKITMYIFTAQTQCVLENVELYDNRLWGKQNYFTCLKSFKTVFWLCQVKMNEALFSNHTFFFFDHRFKLLYCQYCQYDFDHSCFELPDVKCKDENKNKKTKNASVATVMWSNFGIKGTRCNCWKSATQTARSTFFWKRIKTDQHRSIIGLLLLFC